MSAALAFELPAALEARAPAERRGLARDGVRLLVASLAEDSLRHARFDELPQLLAPGDLLVVNVSATLPAALDGARASGAPVCVHVSTAAPALDARWRVVELRTPGGAHPQTARLPETIALEGDARLELVAPYAATARLWLARYDGPGTLVGHLERHGRPITYGYVRHRWPLSVYQNVYATVPGSAEMPSAGRPFTPELITRLVAGGVAVAPIVLHCGVSSPELHEPPFPEYFEVPAATAKSVDATREADGRVIAVGTTVVRALESALDGDGGLRPAAGWTNLVITPDNPPQTVDGIITGWHEPDASHLQMLEALAGEALIGGSYEAALAERYLWHEFGDSHLILRR